jgi:hypothetical protein
LRLADTIERVGTVLQVPALTLVLAGLLLLTVLLLPLLLLLL